MNFIFLLVYHSTYEYIQRQEETLTQASLTQDDSPCQHVSTCRCSPGEDMNC